MTVRFYLDKRGREGVDDLCHVKIAINHKGSSAYIGTDIKVPVGEWDAKREKVNTQNPLSSRYNLILSQKKLRIELAIEELREQGKLRGATASMIKRAVEKYIEESKQEDGNLGARVLEYFKKYEKTKEKARTIESLIDTEKKISAFLGYNDSVAQKLSFEDVTFGWLSNFEAFLAKTCPSANARSVHLRNIRTVYNYALAEGATNAPYPFKKFKIRSQPTKDRSLTVEEVRRLIECDCSHTQTKYRDIFLLSLFLCGINLPDLLNLQESKKGYVEFRRTKTGQPITMTIQPEALEIISKYEGRGGKLLEFGERCANHKNLLHRINDNLKRIGMQYDTHSKQWTGKPLFPSLSYYWARYTWATIAAELDIPEKTIGAALGHSTAKSVTSIYIRVDMRKKVDDANRKVIDKIFNKAG